MQTAEHDNRIDKEKKKRDIDVDTVSTTINAICFENHPAQGCHPRAPRDQDNNFDTILTMVNFRSNNSVASFVLRCQEASHGSSTFKAKTKPQQQIAETRGPQNRRRVKSIF